MAVARQIKIHAEEDGVVAVQTDTIVDPERGIVAEVEKVVAAVDMGGGKVAVMEQNRVRAIRAIPTQAEQRPAISDKPAWSAPQQPKPASAPSAAWSAPQQPKPASAPSVPTTTAATTSSWTPRVRTSYSRTISSSSLENVDKYCIKKRIVWAVSVIFLVVGAALVGLAAYFLLPCAPLNKAGVSIIIIGCLTIVIACIYCTLLSKKRGKCAVFRYVCIGLLLLVFFSVAIAESVYVFDDYNSKKESADDCHNITAVLTTVLASVSYCILVLVSGFCCLHTIASCCDDCCD